MIQYTYEFYTKLHQFQKLVEPSTQDKKKLNIIVIDGPGEPIVFLHGIASNTKVWELVVKPLKVKNKIVLVDLLGFGDSFAPDNIKYNVDDHAYAVIHGLKKAGIRQPAFFVGHSMGSIIATHIAAIHPKKVLGLVLCSLPIYKRSELSDQKLRSWQKDSDNAYFRVYRLLREKKISLLRRLVYYTSLVFVRLSCKNRVGTHLVKASKIP